MKNLTKLQVMMLMGLAVGSVSMHGQSDQENQDEVVALTLEADRTEDMSDHVLQQLSQISPATIEQAVLETAELIPSFQEIRSLVDKKNKEIEKLSAQAVVDEAQIAKIGIELAQAQAALKQAEAVQRAKHKKHHKLEQTINDALKKAEQGLKALNDSVAMRTIKDGLSDAAEFISEQAQAAYESKPGQAVRQASAQSAEFIAEQAQAGYKMASQKAKRIKTKLKSSKALAKASAQQPMLMIEDEDAMIDQAIDDAMTRNDNEVMVQSKSEGSHRSKGNRHNQHK